MRNTLDVEELEKQGKEIAEKIKDTTPLVYSSYTNKALSYVLKIKFNENAKTMAFANVVPELTHNEMTGLTLPKDNFTILLLRDTNDHPRVRKQMELLEDLVKEYKIKIQAIDIIGEGMYNRTFNTLLLGDWISYHLALLYKVDPTKVELVEEFKKRLK